MTNVISMPVWVWVWYLATSFVGVFCIVHYALGPLHRWRDRMLAKINAKRFSD
jgi:hypothetical protein